MTNDKERSAGAAMLGLARTGKSLASIAKAAAAGGLHGAAYAAAKQYAPELIRLGVAIGIVLLVIPMVVISALPNIFFSYDSSSDQSVNRMTQQAMTIGGTYFNLEQFEDSEIDSVVTSIVSSYTEQEKTVNEIVVNNNFTDDDLLWFIAISSVANQQNLNEMSTGGVQQLSASRLSYSSRLRGTTLTITITKREPEQWMEELGFDEKAKTWARSLYETLSKSDALDRYAERYEAYRPSYSGDTGYGGGVQHGDTYENEIDISGFTSPDTKNAHDLAAYAIQAWENNWGYVWGTFGTVLTQSLFDYKLEQYPDGVGNHADYIRAHWLGRRTADCIGLIKGYGWLDADSLTIQYGTNGMPDVGADQMHDAAVSGGFAHGPISTMPETPGLGLWKQGHAGVYIGGGYAIEAMGTRYGVVKTEIAGRGWDEWYEIPYISYDTTSGR